MTFAAIPENNINSKDCCCGKSVKKPTDDCVVKEKRLFFISSEPEQTQKKLPKKAVGDILKKQ